MKVRKIDAHAESHTKHRIIPVEDCQIHKKCLGSSVITRSTKTIQLWSFTSSARPEETHLNKYDMPTQPHRFCFGVHGAQSPGLTGILGKAFRAAKSSNACWQSTRPPRSAVLKQSNSHPRSCSQCVSWGLHSIALPYYKDKCGQKVEPQRLVIRVQRQQPALPIHTNNPTPVKKRHVHKAGKKYGHLL